VPTIRDAIEALHGAVDYRGDHAASDTVSAYLAESADELLDDQGDDVAGDPYASLTRAELLDELHRRGVKPTGRNRGELHAQLVALDELAG
jgi:hypothetical protein